jgi:hypothetical protein
MTISNMNSLTMGLPTYLALGDFCPVTAGRHPPERRPADLSAHELYSKAADCRGQAVRGFTLWLI